VNILVINGPNLNLLGKRLPEIYGTETIDDILTWLTTRKESAGHSIKSMQSNHEGEIIDYIHAKRSWADGIIINPGAFTHYSYAIRDALEAADIPTVEVHLSDIHTRENFRKISVIAPVCIKQIYGSGKQGYLEGLNLLLNHS
jgi:3-dehydroquinate dehydratase-2